MPQGVFSPEIPEDSDLMLGEGAVIADYDEVGEYAIGATKDGSKYEEEREIKEIKSDGTCGKTKTLRRYVRRVPRLKVNFLKLTYENLQKGFPGMTITDKGDYHEIAFDLEIADADYLTNIAFVGQTHEGKAIIIIIYNPLNDGNVGMDFKEKDEVMSEQQYTGHYDPSTPTTCPVEIRKYDV